ncbi:Mur ligase family protein [Nakamurella lactea]|uniref:Mur ligase family protein n=1 Tax=Nakamurella lactea TaxID=459515 RepID=UPI000688F9A6|nr:Mur ligase family protein [Nakamurella lactea]
MAHAPAPAAVPERAAPAAPEPSVQVPAEPVELRLLTGPNLYFSRPAVKLTLDAAAALAADTSTVLEWQGRLKMHGVPVGLPGSPARADGVAELAATLVRRAASAIRTRLPAVAHPGDDDTVVVAFPFRNVGTAKAFGAAVAAAFGAISAGVPVRTVLSAIPGAMAGHDPGEEIRPSRPRIPVIAVTGTNGKTTTTRLIAHLVRAGGRTPGWSSTDGIFIDGVEVERGDWSGPGGAARVLADPSVEVAVTETARGGILLRGLGTPVNDVSVVTNISADHLGLLGVHTVQRLAEVKSVIVRVTKPTGWCVLNADDPLVLAMRRFTRARPWFYSPDPTNPKLTEALDAGGRAITIVDDEIVVLARGSDPTRIVPVTQVPLTLAGASRVNVQNVLAAAAAALAIGVKRDQVAAGLRTFAADAEHNAGRLNSYLVGDTVVVLDLAHNEASLESLLEVTGALRAAGGSLAVVTSTAGDRSDEAIHAMGAMAAAAADAMVIAGKAKYLRDREPGAMEELWAGGAAEAGIADVPRAADELSALTLLLDGDLPPGSAVAVCTLEQREQLVAEIVRRGGHEMTPDEIAARVAGRAGMSTAGTH